MEEGGMVAVVRGLRDAGLAVTLLDSGKQYSLVPNSVLNATRTTKRNSTVAAGSPQRSRMDSGTFCCDSAAQATDGRYASVYRTNFCKVRPTSPPVEITEFPPQRSDICRGHDNFVVGGIGSGDTYYNPVRTAESFRGGMIWTDRGSVCAPRPSRQPDPFADSLRKYPSLSPERSTEIVERLINYTQAPKPQSRHSTIPASSVRCPLEVHCSDQAMPNSKPPNVLAGKPVRNLEADIRIRRFEDSPIRGPKEEMMEKRGIFGRSYDVKYLKDMSKMKDGRSAYVTPSKVHMEIQAAAQMVCREVSTNPRVEYQKENVAVSQSQPASDTEAVSEGAVLKPKQKLSNQTIKLVKAVQTKPEMLMKKSVQTALSSVELTSSDFNFKYNVRKIRSEDFNREEIRDEIIDIIEDIFENTLQKNDVLDNIRVKLKRFKRDRQVGFKSGREYKANCNKTSYNENVDFNKNWGESNIDKVINKLDGRKHVIKAFRAEVASFKISNDFKGVLRDWLNELPMRNRDVLNRVVDKEQIFSTFLKRLKRVGDKMKLKMEIVEILDQIPLEMHSCHNKRVYLNRLANSLMDKLQHVNINEEGPSSSPMSRESSPKSAPSLSKIRNLTQPTVDEMKDFVRAEMLGFMKNFDSNIDKKQQEEIETELTDVLMESIDAIRTDNEGQITDEIISLFRDTAGVFEQQAIYLTNLLIERLKKMFRIIEESHIIHMDNRVSTLMALNMPQKVASDEYDQKGDNKTDLYTQQISEQIDQWLSDLDILIPKSRDNHFRRVVITDLACEIVDRKKYLELNPGSQGTDQDELDHLKYQIFKWINKLVGEDHLETIEHAPDLMRRLSSIPVPFTAKIGNSTTDDKDRKDNSFNTPGSSRLVTKNNSRGSLSYDRSISPRLKFSPFGSPERSCSPQNSVFQEGQSRKGSYGGRIGNDTMVYAQSMNTKSSCCPGSSANSTMNQNMAQELSPSQYLKEVNEEYDQFVQNWAQQIPIPVSNSEEEALIPKLRMGIVNAVFKTLAKLKCQPRLMLNILAYEDAMENELNDIFSQLPPSSELEQKKHELKVSLIKKTTHTNDAVRRFLFPETFKEVVADKFAEYIPRHNVQVTETPAEIFEDIQVLALADDFLLFTRYKDEDPVKAEVYKKKLMEKTREFVEELKKIHGSELMNIDKDDYVKQIFIGLGMVPVPTENTLKDEADEVLLGKEVEQWYNDLPINPNESMFEQLKRRRLRDLFAKKIHEMGKNINISDPSADDELRREVSMFLGKIPLAKDESLNINFMIDELANRIKHREREKATENSPRKSVGFNESVNYDSFTRNIPHSSSMNGMLGGPSDNSKNGEYNLEGPLPPCCMPFSQPCCKSHQNSPIAAPYSPGKIVREPSSYQSYGNQKPLSSSYQGEQFPVSYDQPQVGSVNVTQPNETTFMTLLDTREEEERNQMIRMGIQPPPRQAAPMQYTQQSYMSPEQPYIPITSMTPSQYNNISIPQPVAQSPPRPRMVNPAMMGRTMPSDYGMQSMVPQLPQRYVSMPGGYMPPSPMPQAGYMPQSSIPQGSFILQSPVYTPQPMDNSIGYIRPSNQGYHSMMNPYANSIVQEPGGYGTFEQIPRFNSSKHERLLPTDVNKTYFGTANNSSPEKSTTFNSMMDREAMDRAKQQGYFDPSPHAEQIVTPRQENGQTQWYVMKNSSEAKPEQVPNQSSGQSRPNLRPLPGADFSNASSFRDHSMIDQGARSMGGGPVLPPTSFTGMSEDSRLVPTQGRASLQRSMQEERLSPQKNQRSPGGESSRTSSKQKRPTTPKSRAHGQLPHPPTPTVSPPTPAHGQYLSAGPAQNPSMSGQTRPSCSSTCPMMQGSEGSRVRDGRGRTHPVSTYGQPMWYSTPQQGISMRVPGAPRKMMREEQMGEETEEESDSGRRCRCLERMRRYRKRRVCLPCEMFDVDYRQYPPGCPRYYYTCF